MMSKPFKFILRLLIFPFILVCLLLMTFLESITLEPNWEYWKDYNKPLIELLPWSKL